MEDCSRSISWFSRLRPRTSPTSSASEMLELTNPIEKHSPCVNLHLSPYWHFPVFTHSKQRRVLLIFYKSLPESKSITLAGRLRLDPSIGWAGSISKRDILFEIMSHPTSSFFLSFFLFFDAAALHARPIYSFLHPVSNKHRTTHYSIPELILPPIGSSSRILLPESPPAPPSSPPPARGRSPSPRTATVHCRSTADTSVPPRFCPAPWSPHSA